MFVLIPRGEERGTRVSNHEAPVRASSFETWPRPLLRMRITHPARGSPVLPFWRALLDECADAFLGVARHHVLRHHLGRVAVGIRKAHLGLAVERLLAELD